MTNAKKEHYLVKRLKKLRPVFNAFFDRTATTKASLPVMNVSVATIIKEAQTIQQAIRHIEEGHFDSQELSNELAHLALFGGNLDATIEHDGGYWGYSLSVVNRTTFREGAEYCTLERILDFVMILNEVAAIKLAIKERDAGKVVEESDTLDAEAEEDDLLL